MLDTLEQWWAKSARELSLREAANLSAEEKRDMPGYTVGAVDWKSFWAEGEIPLPTQTKKHKASE